MTPISLTSLFQSIGLPHGISLPLIVLMIFVVLTLPAVFRPSARAEFIGYAAHCYLAQMLGVLLMTAGALPALYAVFASQPLAEVTYLGLLLVFAIGGLLFLWNDTRLRHIDVASKAIPGTLFFMTWKFVGLLITVFAGISLVLRLMYAAERMENWWIIHLIMLLYGLILSWFTLYRPAATTAFTSTATRAPVAAPTVKKPVVPKTALPVPRSSKNEGGKTVKPKSRSL